MEPNVDAAAFDQTAAGRKQSSWDWIGVAERKLAADSGKTKVGAEWASKKAMAGRTLSAAWSMPDLDELENEAEAPGADERIIARGSAVVSDGR